MYTRVGSHVATAAGKLALGSARDTTADVFHKQVAETIRDSLSQLKGLPMKAGQLLSIIDHPVIPKEYRHHYRDAFQPLQTTSTRVRWSKMREVFRSDLGRDPHTVFETFDTEPVASASIGQVYRATLSDGRPVAVKIQYPGIEHAIRSDLKNIGMLRHTLSLVMRSVDVERTLADLSSRVLEECDYVVEQQNQQAFADAWASDSDLFVPNTHPELCGKRVLVSDYVVGASWQGMVATADQATKERFARSLFRFVYRSLYVHGLLNADPHPGNFLFVEDGTVGCLDFGWVERFDAAQLESFATARRLAVAGDIRTPEFREAARGAWGLPDLDDEEWSFMKDYFECLFAPVLEPSFRYETDYSDRLTDLSLRGWFLFVRKSLYKGVREARAPGVLSLGRVTYGLSALLSHLGVESDWGALILEIDAERATP